MNTWHILQVEGDETDVFLVRYAFREQPQGFGALVAAV